MNDSVSVLKGSKSSSYDTMSFPRREGSSSMFGDWSTGEPLRAQRLVLDFTPSEQLDTEYVQKKCCAFWDLVNNSPELQHLMVLPEVVRYSKDEKVASVAPQTDSLLSSESFSLSTESDPCERNAISVLEYMEQKGLATETFGVRQPETCSLGSREYPDKETKPTCSCDVGRHKSVCRNKDQKERTPHSTSELKHLNQVMREWDHNHPKSMDPPGRTALLTYKAIKKNM